MKLSPNRPNDFILNTTKAYQSNKAQPPCDCYYQQLTYIDINENQKFDPQDYVILSHQDGDGKLTENDAHLTSRRLQQMANRRQPDLNNDGWVTDGERVEARHQNRRTDQMDQNADGQISGSELTYRPKSRLLGLPKAFRRERYALARDKNNDGVYSQAEIESGASVEAIANITHRGRTLTGISLTPRANSWNPFADRPLRTRH